MHKNPEELFKMPFKSEQVAKLSQEEEVLVSGHNVQDCFPPQLTPFSCVGGVRGKLLLLGSQNTNVLEKVMYKPVDFHILLTSPLANNYSYYKNIDHSRINCFCSPVSLHQQNNLSQLNILQLWLIHPCRLCSRCLVVLIRFNTKYHRKFEAHFTRINVRLMGNKTKTK